ncbi:hypothetical protein [Mucilaginibacter gotjawali]|uniref:Uncharacterized protein n=1 Tax=Mucilaginibacter gotjawali TaxID=1550579 RepID=A0A839SDQ6_9SPHI|nr:hypothetical protein [Mucilaginibacter gotjawali]MBB3055020.1 hypothetical protein [Mucilaginibacter gotjawali]
MQLPSFLPAKEGVNERSDVRVSQPRRTLPPTHGGEFTHPGFATPAGRQAGLPAGSPTLSTASRKDGKKSVLMHACFFLKSHNK